MKCIIFFHGPDSPGIGSELTRILFNKNCKVLSFRIFTINQFFSAAVAIDCNSYLDLAELNETLKDSLKDYSVIVDILDCNKPCVSKTTLQDEWIPYEVNIICSDMTKTLFYLFKEMSDMNINIFDINCIKLEAENFESYKIIAKIEVPLKIPAKHLKETFIKIDTDLNTMSDIEAINTLEM